MCRLSTVDWLRILRAITMDGSLFSSSFYRRRLSVVFFGLVSVWSSPFALPYHRPSIMTWFLWCLAGGLAGNQIFFSVCTYYRTSTGHLLPLSTSRALWREFVNAPRVVLSLVREVVAVLVPVPYDWDWLKPTKIHEQIHAQIHKHTEQMRKTKDENNENAKKRQKSKQVVYVPRKRQATSSRI
jgi:hypothetical protein